MKELVELFSLAVGRGRLRPVALRSFRSAGLPSALFDGLLLRPVHSEVRPAELCYLTRGLEDQTLCRSSPDWAVVGKI